MSIQWTYGGNPLTSPSDALRFALGDTKPREPLLSDGEVAYLLATYNGDPLMGALAGVESLIAAAGQMVDETVGPVSISFSQRLQNLKDVQVTLRTRLVLDGNTGVYAGGISVSDKCAVESNPDRVQPAFTRTTSFDPTIDSGDITTGPIHGAYNASPSGSQL